MRVLSIFLKTVLVLVLVALLISYFQKDKLPLSEQILSELFYEPGQQETKVQPFALQKGEYSAQIEPLYNYELYGLVVADYDSENWLDFIHKYDPFNTKDICVIWGENLKNNLYLRLKFKHGEFTCFYKAKDWGTYRLFNKNQLSNNHLVPASEEVYKKIKAARVGDQVYIKGQLTNNEIIGPEGLKSNRRTSITRDDSGNGACEVIYTTEFKVIKKGNPFFSLVFRLSKYIIIACLLLLIIIFIIEVEGGWKRKTKDK